MDLTPEQEATYPKDLEECRVLADSATGGKKSGRRTGAVVGAVAGAAAGAATGEGALKGAAVGGGVGAASGGVAGRAQDLDDAQFVLRNCLVNRGYTVLDEPAYKTR